MDMTQGDLTIDSDGDGLLDGEEIVVNIEEITGDGKKGTRAWATMISHPKMVDTDGDGFSDYVEVKGMMD